MRETKQIKLKGGNVVEIWGYLTGKDLREYQKVFFEKLKLKTDGLQVGENAPAPKIEEIPASILVDLDSKMIELMVVSLDSDKTNLMTRIEELRAEEYNALITELRTFFRF